MRHLKVDHSAHRTQHARKVLGLVIHELRFEQVAGAYSEVELLGEDVDDARHDWEVCVELDLPWTVDDDVVVVVLA